MIPSGLARKFLGASSVFLMLLASSSCRNTTIESGTSSKLQGQALEVMALSWQKDLAFDQAFFRSFGRQNGVKTNFIPNARLALYRQLLQAHSSQPDLLEIDVVWPGILADHLLDLRPYLKDGVKAFAPELLASYTVKGKLVAVPLFIDVGVLYYRADLLEKYGFSRPPKTWDELEEMAARIQQGERRAGNLDFWGYVWQGAASEGGTCNALEWQAGAGAGNFIEADGRPNVRSPLFVAALQRAVRWMGSISPPAEYVYWEDDSMNLWDAGQTAFMRNWASGYGHASEGAEKNHRRFGVAPLPGGPGGQRGTLGGLGIGVSKYAANRELAVTALLELTDETNDWQRMLMTNGIPSYKAASERADVKARTALLAVSAELMEGLVARPSAVTDGHYDQVSREYTRAVNDVLRRKENPADRMAQLENTLVRITGQPAQRY